MENIKGFDIYIKEYLNIKKVKLDPNTIVTPSSKEELEDLLEEYNVDISKWGKGRYKTVNHIWGEIEEKECELYGINGTLRREVNFVGAKVLYQNNGQKLKLYEEKAIFKDGRVRVRDDIFYSMAEKFKYGEDLNEALVRGMKEELNITITEEQGIFYNKLYFPENSDYPGIESFHTGYSYIVVLNDEQYIEDGYEENQSDKDIYFKWKDIK
jgi:hypothetical protein